VESGRHASGAAVVRVRGEHDLSTVPALGLALERAAAHSGILVDMSECTFVDSTAIATLIRAGQTAGERGARFVLLIPREQARVRRVTEMMRLDQVLDICVSEDEALARLGQAPA
jgi:anti-sigma B factor antagonist